MRRLRTQNGVGLIEVLVSMILLAFGILGLGMMILTSIDGNTASRENSIAANLIKQQIELFQSMDSLPVVPFEMHEQALRNEFSRSTYLFDSTSDSTVPGGAYQIRVDVAWTDAQQLQRNRSFSTYILK